MLPGPASPGRATTEQAKVQPPVSARTEESFSGLTTASARTLVMKARHRGDHAYRSGAFRWAVENGVWGIIRVR